MELEITNILDLSDNKGLLNSQKIAEECNLEFPPAKNLLPIYPCDDPNKYLFELCKVGLSKRLNGNIPQNYKDLTFVYFHITTSANHCDSFRKNGILDLVNSYLCKDSELRRFLEENHIHIDYNIVYIVH